MSVVCESVRVCVSANRHPHFVLTYAFVLYWKKGCLGKESKVVQIELRAPPSSDTPTRTGVRSRSGRCISARV